MPTSKKSWATVQWLVVDCRKNRLSLFFLHFSAALKAKASKAKKRAKVKVDRDDADEEEEEESEADIESDDESDEDYKGERLAKHTIPKFTSCSLDFLIPQAFY